MLNNLPFYVIRTPRLFPGSGHWAPGYQGNSFQHPLALVVASPAALLGALARRGGAHGDVDGAHARGAHGVRDLQLGQQRVRVAVPAVRTPHGTEEVLEARTPNVRVEEPGVRIRLTAGPQSLQKDSKVPQEEEGLSS